MPVIPTSRQIMIDTDYIRLKRPDFIRADICDLDDMIALYRESRRTERPEFAAAYPSYDEIERDVTDGNLWYAREDGEIIGACAVTPEPVFPLEKWEITERYHKYGRLPEENWFRPGERYISVLRQAAKPGARRRHRTCEVTILAAILAEKCGIHEVRTRNLCDNIAVSRELSTYGYKIVGKFEDTEGVPWYGFFRRTDRRDLAPEDASYAIRPLSEERHGDGLRKYDYIRDVEELAEKTRLHPLENNKRRPLTDEDLMEEL